MKKSACNWRSLELQEHAAARHGHHSFFIEIYAQIDGNSLVVKPDSRPLRVLKGKAQLRRGDVEQAVAVLEAARAPKPEKEPEPMPDLMAEQGLIRKERQGRAVLLEASHLGESLLKACREDFRVIQMQLSNPMAVELRAAAL